jgi:cholesterol transport system auxiliary component
MKPWSFPLPNVPGTRAPAAIVLLLAAMLASCSLTRPAPVKHMYLLEAAAPPAAAVQKTASLRIGVINVAAPFRGRTLVYRHDEITYEADFYSEYFIAPAAMLGEATAKALTAAGVFRRVIPPGAAPDDGEYVLDGFATELYGDARDEAKPAAVMAVTFYLSSASAVTPRVLWSREYRQRVAVADAGPDALARASNAALSAILADLARDLAAASLPKP